MVHLRIVAPESCSADVQRLLEKDPTVLNIAVLPGVTRKPPGDLILCDVPREAASLLIADLRQTRVVQDGSITVEKLDVVLSAAADAAERAAPGEPQDAVVWEEVEELTSESTELTAGFLSFMMLATMLAAIGLLLDSPILIVGAMVLGPEFGPIAALCVALVRRQPRLAAQSFRALAIGFPVGILAALVMVLTFKWTGISPDSFTEKNHDFANLVSSPDAYTVVIAFCAGIAGILSLTTSKSGALTGVLISVTTIPAAAGVAVGAAYTDWEGFAGSLLQLGLNLTFLCIAGVLTLLVQRRVYVRRHRARV
jgi:uncharacterized hydrophobic protein (TIGR00271 family)